jgi:hypothetical protein
MKTKITLLIAAGIFMVAVSNAQYGPSCPDNRVSIQSQVVIPNQAYVDYHYNNMDRHRNDERDNRRDGYYGRYEDQRDWRAVEYERFCHDHRRYNISREEFYRNHCGYRVDPYYGQRRVVVYSHY